MMTANTTTTMSMVALLLSAMLAPVLCSGEMPPDAGAVDGADAVAVAVPVPSRHPATCEDVRLKCAFGPGCSKALHNYFTKCDRILQADPTTCPESCLYALVALTSTEDGKRMLDCTCRDRYCEEMKARVEVCRPFVLEASKNETVVPCELAHWVCMVDPVCTAALGYYHTYCKRMLLGTACTERCLNSVEILQRQEKAAKMNRCRCTGKTAVECLRNKERMVRLCYGGEADPRLQQGGAGGGGGNKPGGRKNRKKHRPRMFDLDPDRAEVEMMMANADYQPDVRNRYNATDESVGDDDDDDADDDDDEGSGSATGLLPGTLLVAAASAYLVAR